MIFRFNGFCYQIAILKVHAPCDGASNVGTPIKPWEPREIARIEHGEIVLMGVLSIY